MRFAINRLNKATLFFIFLLLIRYDHIIGCYHVDKMKNHRTLFCLMERKQYTIKKINARLALQRYLFHVLRKGFDTGTFLEMYSKIICTQNVSCVIIAMRSYLIY